MSLTDTTDLKVSSVTVTAPASAGSGVAFVVTVDAPTLEDQTVDDQAPIECAIEAGPNDTTVAPAGSEQRRPLVVQIAGTTMGSGDDDLGRIGKGLGAALQAYNDAVGSFERRLLPMGRRLDELKVSEQTKRDLVAPQPIDEEPRKVSS